jgi:hypothetical protein
MATFKFGANSSTAQFKIQFKPFPAPKIQSAGLGTDSNSGKLISFGQVILCPERSRPFELPGG